MITLNQKYSCEITNFELLAKQVVEGFITGMHKSPFHGFSVEFSEHKLYNKGESTRHIDWKLFAKTEKLYTKKYQEETNLRCHIIIDNSASMHYPKSKNTDIQNLNKVGFAAVASACLIDLLKKQRDAVGLSIYSDSYEYYAPEKGSERHRNMLMNQLEKLIKSEASSKTNTIEFLHEIAEKIHKRSLVFLFTDMFQTNQTENQLFDALGHLKYGKHEVVLFHTFDKEREYLFNFNNSPKKFIDVETGKEIKLYAENAQKKYTELIKEYFKKLKNKCLQYKIDYVSVDINKGYNQILSSYLISRRKLL
ncbi:MAG: DUF58 domain-containing protein [Tenacibaculum sp.]